MAALLCCVPCGLRYIVQQHATQAGSSWSSHQQRAREAPEQSSSNKLEAPCNLLQLVPALDDDLSRRPIELDRAGYFVIHTEPEPAEIVAEYYTNSINDKGDILCFPSLLFGCAHGGHTTLCSKKVSTT